MAALPRRVEVMGKRKPTWGAGRVRPPRLFVWLGGAPSSRPHTPERTVSHGLLSAWAPSAWSGRPRRPRRFVSCATVAAAQPRVRPAGGHYALRPREDETPPPMMGPAPEPRRSEWVCGYVAPRTRRRRSFRAPKEKARGTATSLAPWAAGRSEVSVRQQIVNGTSQPGACEDRLEGRA